jgi:hypothetical protein
VQENAGGGGGGGGGRGQGRRKRRKRRQVARQRWGLLYNAEKQSRWITNPYDGGERVGIRGLTRQGIHEGEEEEESAQRLCKSEAVGVFAIGWEDEQAREGEKKAKIGVGMGDGRDGV